MQSLNPKEYITIKGARTHNLKNVDLAIPRYKLVVITGLSGSGKSSLAFDTLYAEGQRRYVESLSAYARQFLGKIDKPPVDYIEGISPAIAIEQKVNVSNSRSTVGTATEIYDYLKLLYARIGRTFSPVSGEEVRKDTVTDVVDYITGLEEGTKLLLLAPLDAHRKSKSVQELWKLLEQQGYTRVLAGDQIYLLEDAPTAHLPEKVFLVIQRVVSARDEDFIHRLSGAVELAFHEGHGTCVLATPGGKTLRTFSAKFEKDGISFPEPSVHLFSFNTPYGACPVCNGYGKTIGIDPDRVIPNTALSIYENCIAPWQSDSYISYKKPLFLHAEKYGINIHQPWHELSEEQKELVWNGTRDFEGIMDFFHKLEAKNYKIQNRVILSRYRGKTTCPECRGKRLRKEAAYVKIAGKSIHDLVTLPLDELQEFFRSLTLDDSDARIAERLLTEIGSRLDFLLHVGLGYLDLNRNMNSLSGGETQRIHLATSLGSSLVGSLYILDEPSIGLHHRDNRRLIKVLKSLRDLGNTVIVVEHDTEIMQQADYIVDLGPGAGINGGQIVAAGTPEEVKKSGSLTGKYLSGEMAITPPQFRRKPLDFIHIKGARAHNLKNIDVDFPLHCLCVVTGVSGSGKSTLVKDILYPAVEKSLGLYGGVAGQYTGISGSLRSINKVEFIDQKPIGRSSRSNPVTYVKAYDLIRELMTEQKAAKVRYFTPRYFSFNVDGGRCETCKGEGEITVEMQFMADVHLVCEDCGGKRFKKEVLEVKYQGKNIHDILSMTVSEAMEFFQSHGQNKIYEAIKPLNDVGLGYVQLGQSSSTLSGGEAQRIKLASFLAKGNNREKVLFIFDEPTTGLHLHDIRKLLDAMNALIDRGHSIIVIEHNPDFIKSADYIIDLGPEGGKKGGEIIFQGTPEDLLHCKKSYTAEAIKETKM